MFETVNIALHRECDRLGGVRNTSCRRKLQLRPCTGEILEIHSDVLRDEPPRKPILHRDRGTLLVLAASEVAWRTKNRQTSIADKHLPEHILHDRRYCSLCLALVVANARAPAATGNTVGNQNTEGFRIRGFGVLF